MTAEAKHNLKNTAVKRILQELKGLQDNPSDDFMSFPLGGDISYWQFAIRGPSDTEFEGVIYHGRIQLPAPVRTALVALRAFMPTKPGGALGSLDHTKEERRALAIKSREAAPVFGIPELQMLINEMHQYMLCNAPPIPELPSHMPEKHQITDRRKHPMSTINMLGP